MTIRDLAEAEPVGAAGDRPVALPAPSAISAVSALSDVVDDADDGPDTTPVPTGLDAATPAALLAGEITARRASRPLSVFDLMRIGIGPSSSHTVGPMRAGRAFAGELAGVVVGAHESGRRAAAGRAAPGGGPDGPVTHLVVELYGSLGATGRGHATDRAVVMGLAGYEPETVPPEICQGLHEEVAAAGELVVDGVGALPFDPAADIRFLPGRVLPYHTNALTITAYCAAGDAVLRRTYYSVGGGFVMEDAGAPGAPSIRALATAASAEMHATPAPYPFSSGAELLEVCEREGLRVSEVVMANEVSARPRAEVLAYLDRLRDTMTACIEAGLVASGTLPGAWGCGVGPRRCTSG